MPKALLPMFATLALCGAAALAVIATTAHAQPQPRKPMLVAANETAQSQPGRAFRRDMPPPGEIAAHLRQMCQDGYAHEAGAMAYLDVKLDLTGAQKPAFERWKQVKLDIAKRRADACGKSEPSRAATEKLTVVDLMARHEDMLKRQLADVSAERPALEAFYKSLNAEQQDEFTRAAEHRMMERGRMFVHRAGPAMGGMDRMIRRNTATMPANTPPAPPPQ